MNSIVPVTLYSPRLLLRPPLEEDSEIVEELVSDRRVAETALIPHPYPPGGAREWIRRSLDSWKEGRAATFVICLREDDELVGSISLACPQVGAPNVGYWIALSGWGLGYATEALRRVLTYGFEDLLLPRIHGYHVVENPASGRVMQKAGLHFMDIVPQGFEHGGRAYDDVRYGLSAEEWHAAREPEKRLLYL